MNNRILVLLIDDDRDDQLFFQMAISELEYQIDCRFANDGIKALAMLENAEFIPDFIFLDMNMPKMNGVECLAKIREIKHLNAVPVYMYSTSYDQMIIKKCISLGAAGLIKKPTDISAIYEELLNVFESKLTSH